MIAVGIVFALPFISSGCDNNKATGNSVGEDYPSHQGGYEEHKDTMAKSIDNFAKCLAEKGAMMYGASWCPHCQNQKEMFGESWKNINYVECALPNGRGQAKECMDAGIEGYPTWIFRDGAKFAGELSLQELGQKTGCGV